MAAECTVPATAILARMYGMWATTAFVALLVAAAWLYTRRRFSRREEKTAIDTVFVSIAIPLLLLALSLGPLCWSGDYGAKLNGTRLLIHYYEDKTVAIDICRASISLEPAEKALSLLGKRVNGLDDPLGGILAGNFTSRAAGAGTAMVLALRGTDKAFTARINETMVVLVLPCSEKLYHEVALARHRLCGEKG